MYVYVYLSFTNMTCKRYDIKVINCNLKIYILANKCIIIIIIIIIIINYACLLQRILYLFLKIPHPAAAT